LLLLVAVVAVLVATLLEPVVVVQVVIEQHQVFQYLLAPLSLSR
jgi:hypothetical protein